MTALLLRAAALLGLLGATAAAVVATSGLGAADAAAEFLPYSEATDLTPAQYRELSSGYYSNKFADASQYYDGYQQSWRMLGFYIDCSQRGRDERDEHHHSHDEDNVEKSDARCVRYLIWAAYVDPNYQGGGIGEYMHYNAYYHQWDTRTCSTHGNGRCAPMDCHLTNSTTWKLLGIYKEEQYASEWFEQLFKHAGYCLWSYSTYSWMQNYREAWPEGCVKTSTKSVSGNYLYTDLKPTLGGNMSLALYADSDCRIEYKYASTKNVLQGHYLTGGVARLFNDALEPYKYCQPCRAAAIRSNYGNNNNDDGGRRRLEDDPNDGYFQCDDDAGYTNVNQCMKFRTHTTLYPMTMRDVEDASRQGGMLPIKIGGKIYGQSVAYRPVETKIFEYEEENDMPIAGIVVACGSIALAAGAIILATTVIWVVRRVQKSQAIVSSEPLLGDGKTASDGHEAAIIPVMSGDHLYHLHGSRTDVKAGDHSFTNGLA